MSFLNLRLDDGLVIYDSVGGPEHRTEVAKFESGGSARNVGRAFALCRWDAGSREVLANELEYILKFRRSVRGAAHGFRWKDWGDFKLTRADSRLTLVPGASGATTILQLNKAYELFGFAEIRPIVKPLPGAKFWKNGVLIVNPQFDESNGRLAVSAFNTADVFECECEFDCAVRFSSDNLKYSMLAREDRSSGSRAIFLLEAMPLEELDPNEIWNP
jgi:uncharacterized protein (TIGR02217 family)